MLGICYYSEIFCRCKFSFKCRITFRNFFRIFVCTCIVPCPIFYHRRADKCIQKSTWVWKGARRLEVAVQCHRICALYLCYDSIVLPVQNMTLKSAKFSYFYFRVFIRKFALFKSFPLYNIGGLFHQQPVGLSYMSSHESRDRLCCSSLIDRESMQLGTYILLSYECSCSRSACQKGNGCLLGLGIG